MVVKTHLSVNPPQSVSISGAEINLTLRAVTTYALCCNLATSMSALKMCIFSNIVMKWHDFCWDWDILYKLCGAANKWSKGFIFSGRIWWQLFSCNKAYSKNRTCSTTTPKYTLPQRLLALAFPGFKPTHLCDPSRSKETLSWGISRFRYCDKR